MLVSVVLFLLIRFHSSSAQDEQSPGCTRLFSCGGSVHGIGYPFWGGERPLECGAPAMELRCSDQNLTTIDLAGQSFVVLQIRDHSMRIARRDLWNGFCLSRYESTQLTLDGDLGGYPQLRNSLNFENLCLFYSCTDFNISARHRFSCGTAGVGYVVDESEQAPTTVCGGNITIPVMPSAVEEFRRNETKTMEEVVNQGFEVEYVMHRDTACAGCDRSGGPCRWGNDSAASSACSDTGNRLNLGLKFGIGIGAAAVSAITMCIIFYAYHHRYKKRHATSLFGSNSSEASSCPMVRDLEKAGIHIFDYPALEEATLHFDNKQELGDGSFGVVYKGKLQDGRTVAVKRLYESHYRRVEQFLNEVEILTRLRHQNLVSLYGCSSSDIRELLLVYEYVPNGTLADHLHGARAKPGSLAWITRLNIAVETASALSYLHASGVIHRDIKSANILLDNNYTVKVADFGLSRVRPIDATHVSTAPQGTPGYVDPEYYECYQLTEKSDVYSFGVVLIELLSSQPAIDITRNRHEINLSTMAINRITTRKLHELVDPHIGFESDHRLREMVLAVAELAFQCLQNTCDLRPTMQDVFEVLQEIQIRDNGTDVMDIPADDLMQMKSCSLPVSPK